jgi:tRNA dimethylallyltransferase
LFVSDPIDIVIVQGPTASGKSDLAVRLAQEFSGEIINADSMQVYRGMDIGSAKPSRQMLDSVPHHLVSIIEPDQPFSAADFCRAAHEAIRDIHRRGNKAIIVGGTGLYIKVLTRGLIDSPGGDETIRSELGAFAAKYGNLELYRRLSVVDPVTADKLHPNDLLRIIRALEVLQMTGRPISELRNEHRFGDTTGYRYLKVGIAIDREELYRRIDDRVERMMEIGLVEEVEGLFAKGYSPMLKPMLSLGYRQICDFLMGKYTLQEAVRLIKRDTRRYAKRQMTWFRRDNEIIWFEYSANIAIISENVIEFYCKGAGYGESTI